VRVARSSPPIWQKFCFWSWLVLEIGIKHLSDLVQTMSIHVLDDDIQLGLLDFLHFFASGFSKFLCSRCLQMSTALVEGVRKG